MEYYSFNVVVGVVFVSEEVVVTVVSHMPPSEVWRSWKVLFCRLCNRVAIGQEMVRGKIYYSMSRNFILSQGKLKHFSTADLIPLNAGRNIWGHRDLNGIFTWNQRKICWVERREAASRCDILYLFGRVIFIFREKSGNFESDVLEHVKSCPHAVENPK